MPTATATPPAAVFSSTERPEDAGTLQTHLARMKEMGWFVTHLSGGIVRIKRPDDRRITELNARLRSPQRFLPQLNRDLDYEATWIRFNAALVAEHAAKVEAIRRPSNLPPIEPGEDRDIETFTVQVGGAEAREILDRSMEDPHFRQREYRLAYGEKWRDIINRGEWVKHPDGISLDPAGVALNGMNRLHGIILAAEGKPDDWSVPVRMNYYVPRRLFAHFDNNRTRTVRDTLHIDGLPSDADTGSAVKLAWCYDQMLGEVDGFDRKSWRSWNRAAPTNAQLQLFYLAHPQLTSMRELCYGPAKHIRMVPAALMVFRYYADRALPEGAVGDRARVLLDEFLKQLHQGRGFQGKEPAHVLREWSLRTAGNRSIHPKREIHMLLLWKAWLLHANGKGMSEVRYKANGDMVDLMPLPFVPGEAWRA